MESGGTIGLLPTITNDKLNLTTIALNVCCWSLLSSCTWASSFGLKQSSLICISFKLLQVFILRIDFIWSWRKKEVPYLIAFNYIVKCVLLTIFLHRQQCKSSIYGNVFCIPLQLPQQFVTNCELCLNDRNANFHQILCQEYI